ncbi:MAG: phosphatase PAP2 family protein [Parachlamydiales bacterium]|nr:phosphatase PAP2 family protein [Parachlamydiales bacterium]
MMNPTPSNLEFEIIETIQKIRCPFFDGFFKFMNFFDLFYFFFILIPLVLVGYNYRLGLKLFFVITLSGIANYFVKLMFMFPRPFEIMPQLTVIMVKGFSFPSGAAQTAIILPGMLIHHFKGKKWTWVVGGIFFFLLSLSRVYLGVHFPRDILLGWFIGILILLVYLYLFPLIEKVLKKMKPINAFVLSQVIFLPTIFLIKDLPFSFFLLPVSLGVYLSYKYGYVLASCTNFFEFIKRSVFAVLGFFLIFFIFKKIFPKNFYLIGNILGIYLSGLWLSFFSSYLYKKAIK